MSGQGRDPSHTSPPRGPGRVHIYGGGISGLTAAHELARRGFRVRVYEPAQEFDETGQLEGPQRPYREKLAVGGIARSQYLNVEKGAAGNFAREGQLTADEPYLHFYKLPRNIEDEDKRLVEFKLDKELFAFAARCGFSRGKSPGVLYIRTPPSKDSKRFLYRWGYAKSMRGYLTTPLPNGWGLDPDRVVVVIEDEEQLARELDAPLRPLEDKEELLLQVLHFLPGEHGFRFFPSYYRHVYSTMVETPILDAEGRPTGRRVFDNLVPSSFYGIAARGRRIRFLRRTPSTRPVEKLQDLRELASSGYPPSDMLQFTLRIWRYMCTSSERRKAEYESITWWEYLEGFDPKTGTRRYHYSEAFRKDMQFAPRVLAAFDGAWGDARTNGNTLAQLYLNNVLPLPKTDGTLNGPTTPAWFTPWRRYLEEYLRVEFRRGWLRKLVLCEGRVIPFVERRTFQGSKVMEDNRVEEAGLAAEPVDYYVVATDAVAAEGVTDGLPRIGVVKGLRGYTTRIPPNPRGAQKERPRREDVFPGRDAWDRFQTLTGIQFFFPSSIRLAEGYLYFLDAPWGLSAINSQQYWDRPPTVEQDGFGAVLSVDIGNWFVREPELKSPSGCSRHEIAHEVWRQIKVATREHNAPLPHARQGEFALPAPTWYSMDRFIRFETDPGTGRQRPVKNLAPYLIPIVGDWERRPGTEPWDPLAPAREAKPEADLPEGVWQAPHGGYPVHWGQLVFAGTYLKTFTRMTTMESANESARHAVNAIIDHYLAHKRPEHVTQPGIAASPAPAVSSYGGGSLTGSPDFRMTPIGEYCRVWNPEQHELAELVPIRELDAKLFAAGLPHLWDVLRLEPLAIPLLQPLSPGSGAEALLGLLRELCASHLDGGGSA